MDGGSPFSGVQSDYYWSSSTVVYGPADAWYVYLLDGYAYARYKTDTVYVWPVRGGQ